MDFERPENGSPYRGTGGNVRFAFSARGLGRLSLLAVVVSLWACAGDAGPTTSLTEPCLAESVPYPQPTGSGNVRHVHDPEIVREGDAYYVLSTNDGVPIRRSTDLLHWEFLGRIFPNQLPSWASGEVPGVQSPWAPGIGYFSNRYHLYYSLSTFGSQRSVIGLATNSTLNPDSPDYAWMDHGKVIESHLGDDHNAIDAAVVLDADERPWLVWGSWSGGIKMRALDPETGLLSGDDETEYSLSRRPIESAVEGPFIVRRGNWYYLFVSFDLCCRGVESTYNVRVGRSEAVTGPYTDRDGADMLEGGGTMVLGGYGRVHGPGHASVLAEDGEYLLVHHYYDGFDGGVPHLQVRPLLWDDEGWPVAGAPHDGTRPGPPPADPDLSGRWGFWTGSGPARAVELEAEGIVRTCDAEGTWSYTPPMLTVRWTKTGSPEQERTDRMVLSADGDALAGRTSDRQLVHGYRLAPM